MCDYNRGLMIVQGWTKYGLQAVSGLLAASGSLGMEGCTPLLQLEQGQTRLCSTQTPLLPSLPCIHLPTACLPIGTAAAQSWLCGCWQPSLHGVGSNAAHQVAIPFSVPAHCSRQVGKWNGYSCLDPAASSCGANTAQCQQFG